VISHRALDAIDALGASQDEVTLLRLSGGLGHAEIATLVNMTPADVRKTYSWALDQLRNCVPSD
jgi:DNA-directed RNA polymerase specialized sigma24 family protein